MDKTVDRTFPYRGYHGCASQCRLRVWEAARQASVVLLTEQAENMGTSVTNRIEHLAGEVYKLLERPEAGITVIEHYPDRAFVAGRPMFRECFALVTFADTSRGYARPAWQRMTKEEVEQLIGETLCD